MDKRVKVASVLVVFIVVFSIFVAIPTISSLINAIKVGYYVKYTLDLIDHKLLDGNAVIKVPIHNGTVIGGEPSPLSGIVFYVPSSGDVYVGWNGSILVINSSTNQIIKNISVGGSPWAMAYDEQNGNVYVTEGIMSSVIVVINSTTNTIINKINVGSFVIPVNSTSNTTVNRITFGAGPTAILYDPQNGYIYVATAFSGHYKYVNATYNVGNSTRVIKTVAIVLTSSIDVIDPATGNIIKEINIGQEAEAMAYDPQNGYIYVVDEYTNRITIIDGKTNAVIGNFTVGESPSAILYDPSNGYLYVTDAATNTVAVINPETNTVIKNITVGNKPIALAYNPKNGDIYVVDSGSDSVTIINDKTNTVIGSIKVGLNPISVAYNPSNGYIYVYNEGSDTISVISPGMPLSLLLSAIAVISVIFVAIVIGVLIRKWS